MEKAKKYFDESLKSYQENPNPRGLGELYNNYAQLYDQRKEPEIAKINLGKVEKEFLSIDDKFGLSDTYLFLAQIYFNENDLEKSLEFANKSFDFTNELSLRKPR